MNKVLLTGRLTRDPELRVLASGKNVTTFSVATNEYVGNGKEKAEFHSVVTWDRLADICASYLGKGMTVALEGRIQTRQWDDDRGAHHWKTEIVASAVEMLSGRRKKDYAADALAVQANALGVPPAVESGPGDDDDDAEPASRPATLSRRRPSSSPDTSTLRPQRAPSSPPAPVAHSRADGRHRLPVRRRSCRRSVRRARRAASDGIRCAERATPTRPSRTTRRSPAHRNPARRRGGASGGRAPAATRRAASPRARPPATRRATSARRRHDRIGERRARHDASCCPASAACVRSVGRLADHDDDLAAPVDPARCGVIGQRAEAAAQGLLVELRQLAADRRGSPRAAGSGKVGERRRETARAPRTAPPSARPRQPGKPLPPFAPASREEALEAPARPGDPRGHQPGEDRRGPGDGHHAATFGRPGRHEAGAGIGNERRAGVRDEREVAPRPQVCQEPGKRRGLVARMVRDEVRRDPMASEEPARDPGVLRGDERHRAQDFERSQRDVTKVADGRRDDVQGPAIARRTAPDRSPAPACSAARARLSPIVRAHRRAEPGLRRG